MTLLSNPILDQLYNIRRILVGQFNVHHKLKQEYEMNYYEEKVKALDEAIASYIEQHTIAPEHVEQTMLERARQSLGYRPNVIIPGDTGAT